jgi:hypothetical protein
LLVNRIIVQIKLKKYSRLFNKNYPNDPNHKNYKDRERILGRIIAEKKEEVYGINSPIGTPCKK